MTHGNGGEREQKSVAIVRAVAFSFIIVSGGTRLMCSPSPCIPSLSYPLCPIYSLRHPLSRVHFSDVTSPLSIHVLTALFDARAESSEKSIFYTFHRRKWTFRLPGSPLSPSSRRRSLRAYACAELAVTGRRLGLATGYEERCVRITMEMICGIRPRNNLLPDRPVQQRANTASRTVRTVRYTRPLLRLGNIPRCVPEARGAESRPDAIRPPLLVPDGRDYCSRVRACVHMPTRNEGQAIDACASGPGAGAVRRSLRNFWTGRPDFTVRHCCYPVLVWCVDRIRLAVRVHGGTCRLYS